MQARSKLVLLELIGGVLGWIWIAASLASIYLLVTALAFGGRWSGLFWALGTGAVAKWLARGFKDSCTRVAYEAELVSRGLSPKQAGEAWFKAYTGSASASVPVEAGQAATSETSSEAALLEVQELVNRYGAVQERGETLIASEALLPAPKERIKDALVVLARHARASPASGNVIEHLRFGYAFLANYVPDNEAHAATTFEGLIGAAGGAQLSSAALQELAGKIAVSGDSVLDVQGRSAEDFKRLAAEFDKRLSG